MDQAIMDTNLLFAGTYLNPLTPLWAKATAGGAIGPDIQVSTVSVNGSGGGAVILDATGTLTSNFKSAPVVFLKTTDVGGGPSIIALTPNVPNGGGTLQENVSVVNDTRSFYDPLSVGELNVYGLANTIQNPIGSVGVIGQFGTTTDMEVRTTGFHTSNLLVSSINGGAYPPGDLGPNPAFSTVTLNEIGGRVVLNSKGTFDNLSSASIEFKYTPDLLTSYNPELKMETNLLAGSLGPDTVENVSLIKGTPSGSNYYDTMALGDLLLYGVNNATTNPVGQVALFRQFSTTTDVECITTGFNTSNLIVSTINGAPYGPGGGVGPNILVSTINVNPTGYINMTADVNASTSQLLFQTTPGPGSVPTKVAMTITNVKNATGLVIPLQNLALTQTTALPPKTTYDSLALGNLYVYGSVNPVTSTIGQLGVFENWSTTSTDLQLRTSGFHTSSFYVSSIVCDSINSSQPILVSTISTNSINASVVSASTLALFNNAPVDLGGVNLGLGEFLGNYTGAFAGQTLAMTLAGSALGVSLVGAIVPRLEGNITPPGQPSTFQTINLQTQLQYSTINTPTYTYTRYVSSIDGGTITPGTEYIVSSIIAPGTVCIRSFSDPINLANPSTFTSTVQSFGFWTPVPQQPTTAFSTVTGDFVVRSTLTTYKENISTTLNVQGLITGGNIASQGVITAGSNIVATGTVQAGVNVLASQNIQAINAIITGNITTVGIGVSGSANVTGAITADMAYITNDVNAGRNVNATGNISSFSANSQTNSISSLTVSSINGLPYNPGGGSGGTLGIFSTLLVSSIANISSLNVVANINTSTINTNRISTNALTANTVTANLMQFGSGLGNITALNNAGGIYNPINGLITFASGAYSTLKASTITTSNAISDTISTQQLLISTVNGVTYPPPFNSTIQGNLYVTSTLVAHDIDSATTILASGNITSATGSMVAINGQFNQLTVLGPITGNGLFINSGNMRNTGNAVIGGVGLGAVVAGRNSGDIWGRGLFVSSINTSGNLQVIGSALISGGITSIGAITTSQLNMQDGGITNLSSVNGVVYPPFIPSGSTFNQVFTSSMLASTIYSYQTYTSTLNASTITASTMNLPGIFMNLNGPAGTIGANVFSGGNGTFGNINLGAGGTLNGPVGTINISSVNGLQITPNPNYSTVVVSSSALIGGFLTASGASIGGSQFTLGGLITTSTLATRTVQASVLVSGLQGDFTALSTGAITAPIVNATQVSTNTLNSAYIQHKVGPLANQTAPITFINTPLVGSNTGIAPEANNNNINIVSSMTVGKDISLAGNIYLTASNVSEGFATGVIVGGPASQIFLSTSTSLAGNAENYSYITPAFIQTYGLDGSNVTTNMTPGNLLVQTAIGNQTTIQGGTISTLNINTNNLTTNSINIDTLTLSTLNATRINTSQVTTSGNQQTFGNPTNFYLNGTQTPPPPPAPSGGYAPNMFGMLMTSTWSQPAGNFWISGTLQYIGNLYIPYSLDTSCPSYFIKLGLVSNGSRAGYGPQIQGLWDIMTYLKTDGANGRVQSITITPVFATNVTLSSASSGGFWRITFTPSQGGSPNNDVYNGSASWIVTQVA